MYKMITGLMLSLMTCIVLPVSSVSAQTANVTVNEESGTAYKAGLDLFKNRKYDEATAKFKEAYELDNRNVNALFARGLALNKQKKDTEAAEVIEQLLQIDPSHEKSLKLLPAAYAGAGMTDKALNAYDRGIAAYPGNYYFYHAKGVLHMKLREYTEAASLFRTALEKAPGRMEILEKLAFVYKDAGDMENAYAVACDILAKDDSHARARVISADYLRMSGKLEDALKEYELAAKDIETKAYAEHFIEVINQQLEEQEIEREYQERLRKQERNRNRKGG